MMSALPRQQRPDVRPVNFDGVPASLTARPHWLLWRWEHDGRRWTKVPIQANGHKARTNDPNTWSSFDDVRDSHLIDASDGIGIVLHDGLFGIDLDDVRDMDGNLEPWAAEVLQEFADTYAEVSPSGSGLHVLGFGKVAQCGKRGPGNRLECYDEGSSRYFTVTGHEFRSGCDVTEQQEGLNWLHKQFFNKPSQTATAEIVQLRHGSDAQLLDSEIIAKATQVGHGDKFQKLFFNGDQSEYESASEADLALANMLAYWTQDLDQLDRLFRQSQLFRSEKWDRTVSSSGTTYGQVTITKALSGESAHSGAKTTKDATGLTQESASGRRCDDGFVLAADFMAESVAVDWLVDGFLEQTATCTLFGASGSGKSFVALDWACCVATGRDWHGNEVEPGAVFYIVGEGQNGFKRRLKAWEKKNGISLTGKPLYLRTIPVPLLDGDSAERLAKQIGTKVASAPMPPRLIVIDTLARNFGNGDENSNTDVNRLIAKLDEHLRIPFNASVVIVHHSGNSEKDRARGASALKAAMDHEYRVEARGDRRLLKCTKMKDGPDDFEFHFQVESLPIGDGGNGGVLVPLDVPAKKTGANLTDGAIHCLSVLRKITDPFGVSPSDELKQADGIRAPDLVVPKAKWKEAAIDDGLGKGSKDDSKRKSFDRAIEQLVREGLVGNYGEYYWVK